MTDDVCGYEDTTTGHPCKRPAGWGRDTDTGNCKDHAESTPDDPAHRPTKLTKQREENIAQMIERGHSIRAAARANGVHHHTILNWLSRGEEQDEGIFADFFDRITRAQGEGERAYVDAIMEIAKETDDPYMLMSMLKQRYPDSWGETDIGGDNEVTISLEREVVDPN